MVRAEENVPAIANEAGRIVDVDAVATVAPFKVTVFAALPKPASDVTASVPPVTVMLPVKVFAPVSTKRPEPALVKLAVPPTIPSTVKIPVPSASVGLPLTVIIRLLVSVTAPVPRSKFCVPRKVKSPAHVCTGFVVSVPGFVGVGTKSNVVV